MGYRSTVGLCLSAKGKQSLEEVLQKHKTQYPDCTTITEFIEAAEVRTNETSDDIVYIWKDTKWYSIPTEFGHDPINFINNCLNELDIDDYLLIIIGEELDDIEHSGNYCENSFGMRLIREIVFEPESI